MPRLEYGELAGETAAEPSAQVRARVEAARLRQQRRLARYGLYCNAQMSHRHVKATCKLSPQAVAEAIHLRNSVKMSVF